MMPRLFIRRVLHLKFLFTETKYLVLFCFSNSEFHHNLVENEVIICLDMKFMA